MYEYVHRRSVTRGLVAKRISSNKSFEWLSQMRFYFDPRQADVLKQLSIHMADTQFHYGFEYLGVQERLVTTPVTDRCYLTMTQALASNLGGSPFGPAGTGKTETVKALGNQLGRFVHLLLYTSTLVCFFTPTCLLLFIYFCFLLLYSYHQVCLGLQLRRGIRLPGHGQDLRGSLPGRGVGLLRRV